MKRIISIVAIILILLTIKNIISSINRLRDTAEVAKRQEEQLRHQQQTHAFLQEQLKYVQTDEFVEQEARNKLGLVKQDEYVVLAPPPTKNSENEEDRSDDPNWKKWIQLFL